MSAVKIDSPESPFVCFTEFRKKVGDDDYAVLHITLRDADDQNGMLRLNRLVDDMVAKGWQHADSPRPQKGSWGGGGKGKPKKVEISADGRFEVRALTKAHFAEKDNLRVYGVNGEETVAWEGRAMKEFLVANTGIQPVQDAFSGWAAWALNEEHAVMFQNNVIVAQCVKSPTSGSWYVKEFLIEPKVK